MEDKTIKLIVGSGVSLANTVIFVITECRAFSKGVEAVSDPGVLARQLDDPVEDVDANRLQADPLP